MVDTDEPHSLRRHRLQVHADLSPLAHPWTLTAHKQMPAVHDWISHSPEPRIPSDAILATPHLLCSSYQCRLVSLKVPRVDSISIRCEHGFMIDFRKRPSKSVAAFEVLLEARHVIVPIQAPARAVSVYASNPRVAVIIDRAEKDALTVLQLDDPGRVWLSIHRRHVKLTDVASVSLQLERIPQHLTSVGYDEDDVPRGGMNARNF
mmetsp:Transcript_13366/g.36912  ORF Transcript_13366/g.36912 Transcript_13366/m.36912 type:complete len:206 (-) Transcript_13366:254-871(-)